MKAKLKKKYILEFYRNNLLNELHNLRQGNMSVWDCIARFDDLTLHCDMRKDHYQIISKFCSGLRSDIRRPMFTSSYYVPVEEAYHLSLELELSFQWIFIPKTREQCSKCERYEHCDCQCPLENRHANIVPSDRC